MALLFEELTESIIGAAIDVHRHLGSGLLESTYRVCLARELELRGRSVQSEVLLPLEYKGKRFENAYRLDLWVEKTVVIEIKAVQTMIAVHEAQLLTYLRLTRSHVGLLMNFQQGALREGIRRFIL